jgi:hypothetical protein
MIFVYFAVSNLFRVVIKMATRHSNFNLKISSCSSRLFNDNSDIIIWRNLWTQKIGPFVNPDFSTELHCSESQSFMNTSSWQKAEAHIKNSWMDQKSSKKWWIWACGNKTIATPKISLACLGQYWINTVLLINILIAICYIFQTSKFTPLKKVFFITTLSELYLFRNLQPGVYL